VSAVSEASGREALVEEVRRLAEVMVAAEVDDAEAASAAAVVAGITRGLAGSPPLGTPWFWRLPTSSKDGSAGWLRHNPVAPPVRIVRVADGILTGELRFGMPYVGPPGRVHGGYLAAVLDHVLGMYLSAIGRPSLTLSLTTSYAGPTPLNVDLALAAGHSIQDGRKTHAWAEIRHNGVTTSRAEGLFLMTASDATSQHEQPVLVRGSRPIAEAHEGGGDRW
jgi:acyl-coenzyme A thioesterase PaaI-like protein